VHCEEAVHEVYSIRLMVFLFGGKYESWHRDANTTSVFVWRWRCDSFLHSQLKSWDDSLSCLVGLFLVVLLACDSSRQFFSAEKVRPRWLPNGFHWGAHGRLA